MTEPAIVLRLIRFLTSNVCARSAKNVQQGRIPLRPGVADLLAELRSSGIRLAIATTTSPENVTALIASAFGTDGCSWFDVIGAGDVVPIKKPDPGIYYWVLRHLALPATRCLAIEDSNNGLCAALAAGLPTLITRSFYCSKDSFEGAAAIVDNLDGSSDLGQPQAASVTVQQIRRWHHHRDAGN